MLYMCLTQALGQVGRVVKIRPSGDVRVAVNGSRWVFNPKSLTLAPGEIPIEERTGELLILSQCSVHVHVYKVLYMF